MELKSISQTIDLPYDGGEFDLENVSAFDGQTKRFACEAGNGVEIVPVSFKGKKTKVGKVTGSGTLKLLFWY